MAGSHDPQLLKGVLSVLLLKLLAERESYGYELVQRLHRADVCGRASMALMRDGEESAALGGIGLAKDEAT